MQILQPQPGWVAPKGYANGVATEGRIVFIGGQIGWNAVQRFETTDFVGQARRRSRTLSPFWRRRVGAPRTSRGSRGTSSTSKSIWDAGKHWATPTARSWDADYPAMSAVEVTALMEDAARVESRRPRCCPLMLLKESCGPRRKIGIICHGRASPTRFRHPSSRPELSMNAPDSAVAKAKARFAWDDPLLLADQLTEEERMVRDTAHAYAQEKLVPRVTEAFRHEKSDPSVFPEMGALGLLGATLPSQYGGAGLELRLLRPDRPRNRARRFGLPVDDERAELARDVSDLHVWFGGAAEEIPAEARDRRVDRLFRLDRAQPRLRSRQHGDAREERPWWNKLSGAKMWISESADRRRLRRLGEDRRRRDLASSWTRA